MAAARYASRVLGAAGTAYSAYSVAAGAGRMADGFRNGDSQQVAGGAMQAYGGATGPLFATASMGARAVHAGSVFGARMAIPQERQDLRNRISASVQAAADLFS